MVLVRRPKLLSVTSSLGALESNPDKGRIAGAKQGLDDGLPVSSEIALQHVRPRIADLRLIGGGSDVNGAIDQEAARSKRGYRERRSHRGHGNRDGLRAVRRARRDA